MLKYKVILTTFYIFFGALNYAQVIDNTASFKNNNSDKYVRLHVKQILD